MKISLAIGVALLSASFAFSFCAAFAEKELAPNHMDNMMILTNTTNATNNVTLVYVGSINLEDPQNKTLDDLLKLILTGDYNTSDTTNNVSDVANHSKNIPIYFQGPLPSST